MPRKSAAKAKSLTERDKAILSDLTRCRVLTDTQIHRAYWPAAQERTCTDRLSQLEKSGYITSKVAQGEKPGDYLNVYSLSTKGKKWATSPEGPGLDVSIVFASPGKINEIAHQIRTNDIYFTLSLGERDSWRIGDALEIEHNAYAKGNSYVAPDASFFNNNGKEIYIETDIGNYRSSQIKAKVGAYRGKNVTWLCPEYREKTLRRYGAENIKTYSRR